MNMEELPETKWCRICALHKPLGDFREKANGKYGRHTYCKECQTLEAKAYYYDQKRLAEEPYR
jgi:hypothetical protein